MSDVVKAIKGEEAYIPLTVLISQVFLQCTMVCLLVMG